VTNNLALQNIRRIKKGDSLLIYHTGAEKAIAGLAEAAGNPYPDPDASDEKIVVFDLKPKRRAKNKVTLGDIKQIPALRGFQLVRLPRLSVVEVSEEEWKILSEMCGI
jgi:predicted RNA-binding protein with PUA-like domain